MRYVCVFFLLFDVKSRIRRARQRDEREHRPTNRRMVSNWSNCNTFWQQVCDGLDLSSCWLRMVCQSLRRGSVIEQEGRPGILFGRLYTILDEMCPTWVDAELQICHNAKTFCTNETLCNFDVMSLTTICMLQASGFKEQLTKLSNGRMEMSVGSDEIYA